MIEFDDRQIEEDINKLKYVIRNFVVELETDKKYELFDCINDLPTKYCIYKGNVFCSDNLINLDLMEPTLRNFSMLLHITKLIEMNIVNFLTHDFFPCLKQQENSVTTGVNKICKNIYLKILKHKKLI